MISQAEPMAADKVDGYLTVFDQFGVSWLIVISAVVCVLYYFFWVHVPYRNKKNALELRKDEARIKTDEAIATNQPLMAKAIDKQTRLQASTTEVLATVSEQVSDLSEMPSQLESLDERVLRVENKVTELCDKQQCKKDSAKPPGEETSDRTFLDP